jgi:hypothetical protein
MANRETTPLKNILLDTFYVQVDFPPQEERQMWAIREGIRRVNPSYYYDFGQRQARKDHQCIRGCEIKNGDTYFYYKHQPGYDQIIKLCPRCMTMILYFLKVDRMKPEMYTHWDEVKHEPVDLEPD